MSSMSDTLGRLDATRLLAAKTAASVCFLVGLVVIPALYALGFVSIETVNMLGRYMTFAIVAIGLDLVWGYTGILSLCQALFFCLGGYAMGMYLAHHGGPEGITDRLGWKLPACLYVVYPYEVGEVPEDAMVPWFWKPFWNLPFAVLLGILIPGFAALTIGYFGFRSRVRGVYFAILTQALAVALFLFFQRNEVKFCGTNGLTRFVKIASQESITTIGPVNRLDHGDFMKRDSNWNISGSCMAVGSGEIQYKGIGTGTLQTEALGGILAGKQYTALFNTPSAGTKDIHFSLDILAEGGDPVDTFKLSPIALRGTSSTEWRVDFESATSSKRLRFNVASEVEGTITLSSFRLYERYNSANGGFTLSEPRVQLALYSLTVLALGTIYIASRVVVRSRFGRVLVAVRDDETSLRFFGYKPWAYKLAAFVFAAIFAGLGGMLYVPQMKIITPYDMEPARSILVVIWVAVGGRGTLAGAILGALSVNLLYDYFTSAHDYGLFKWKAEYWQFILGALFIGVVLIFPQGLIKIWHRVVGVGGTDKRGTLISPPHRNS